MLSQEQRLAREQAILSDLTGLEFGDVMWILLQVQMAICTAVDKACLENQKKETPPAGIK
jgi:hypothetical protein